MDKLASIQAFCSVAAEGGFSAASRRLGLSTLIPQPAATLVQPGGRPTSAWLKSQTPSGKMFSSITCSIGDGVQTL